MAGDVDALSLSHCASDKAGAVTFAKPCPTFCFVLDQSSPWSRIKDRPARHPRIPSEAMSRLSVLKTYKLYVGGKFPRGESGRVAAAKAPNGDTLGNYCVASRKDFRDAVVAARKAQPGW